jgi:ADP-ribosylglycohydrolase
MYENQYDLFRKLKFIVKAGKVNDNESMALEMIDDYLKRKEVDLKDLRQAGLEEWISRRKKAGSQRVLARERPQNNGKLGLGKSLVPVVPVSRVSLWSKVMSRIKGE